MDLPIRKSPKALLVSVTMAALGTCWAAAVEYHVSPAGADEHEGLRDSPFRTIGRAAAVARAGDVITVHAGTYRERVDPARGGSSEENRIVYQAAPGAKVVIKGSEIISQWQKVKDGVWKADLPDSFFGEFNPYRDVIGGEWYERPRDGFDRHTGAVYLNGEWLDEARALEDVLRPGDKHLWHAVVNGETTTIHARFGNADPTKELVEINVRQSVFYPSEPGRNYITVRGFTMRHAATPWAGAMSGQIGLIGTHWSKGWIIEDNIISHSINTGITLGRYDLARYGIAMPPDTAPGFVRSVELALEHGWSKENIGSHVVRRNHISHCEKNGIHGSLGGIFSIIEGNVIHDIATRGWTHGPDLAGLKLLASHDTIIRHNHIHRCGGVAGIWLDWMAQGTRVTGNLLHDNPCDLFMEVNHGPYLIDHNLFLSDKSLREWSQGGAYAHNLFGGALSFNTETRRTPYFKPHCVDEMKLSDIQHKDLRFYHNVFTGKVNRQALALSPHVAQDGNLFLEAAPVSLVEKDGTFVLHLPEFPPSSSNGKHKAVTSELLGRAAIPGARFEQPDASPYLLDTDYSGKPHNPGIPNPGPLALARGADSREFKVWPK